MDRRRDRLPRPRPSRSSLRLTADTALCLGPSASPRPRADGLSSPPRAVGSQRSLHAAHRDSAGRVRRRRRVPNAPPRARPASALPAPSAQLFVAAVLGRRAAHAVERRVLRRTSGQLLHLLGSPAATVITVWAPDGQRPIRATPRGPRSASQVHRAGRTPGARADRERGAASRFGRQALLALRGPVGLRVGLHHGQRE